MTFRQNVETEPCERVSDESIFMDFFWSRLLSVHYGKQSKILSTGNFDSVVLENHAFSVPNQGRFTR